VTADRWREVLDAYFAEHAEIPTGAEARGPALFVVDESPERRGRWVVRQILADPEGYHEWGVDAEVDLDASDAAGTAVVRVTGVGRL
jgi:hypothetical protein